MPDKNNQIPFEFHLTTQLHNIRNRTIADYNQTHHHQIQPDNGSINTLVTLYSAIINRFGSLFGDFIINIFVNELNQIINEFDQHAQNIDEQKNKGPTHFLGL